MILSLMLWMRQFVSDSVKMYAEWIVLMFCAWKYQRSVFYYINMLKLSNFFTHFAMEDPVYDLLDVIQIDSTTLVIEDE